jgi:integrase
LFQSLPLFRTDPHVALVPQAERQVVIVPALTAVLEKHRDQSPFTAAHDFVFASTRGTPLGHRNVQRRALEQPATAAGITGEPKLRLHDLRHTFASMLIAQGANVVFVSQQLGRANPAITLSVYAHEFARANMQSVSSKHSNASSDTSSGKNRRLE